MTQSLFDVIVVGTGPGGGTVAREMVNRNKKVLMLERGSDEPVRGELKQYIKGQCIPGKSLLVTGQGISMVRGIATGGSSLFYYATAFPVPFEMLEKYGINIRSEIDEARRELPVAPLKDEMVTPMARRIMDSACSLGYNWKKLEKLMFQERWMPHHSFGYYGDPHNVKWSSRMFVREALENGAVLKAGAKVTRVITEGGQATGVEYRHEGKLKTAHAEHVVIAAGGIGSPVILKNSGIEGTGRDLFFDPLISVCGQVQDLKKQDNEIPMSAGCHMEEEGYVMTDMALPNILDRLFAAQVFRFHRMHPPASNMRIMIKARDTLGGFVTGREGIRKTLTTEDKGKLLRGYRRAKEILENAGARGIYKTWYLAAHPGGTVKIGEHLDSQLSTQIKNLHVCDCSVIPEPWGMPPTLTLVGLGKHLARILSGEKE